MAHALVNRLRGDAITPSSVLNQQKQMNEVSAIIVPGVIFLVRHAAIQQPNNLVVVLKKGPEEAATGNTDMKQ